MSEYSRIINQGPNCFYGENSSFTIIQPKAKDPIPANLTTPPPNPDVFIGRQADLETMRRKLSDGNLLLLVTARAASARPRWRPALPQSTGSRIPTPRLAVRRQRPAPALLRLALELQVEFPPEWPGDRRLDKLLAKLADLPAPCLLILDNVNDLARPGKPLSETASLLQLPHPAHQPRQRIPTSRPPRRPAAAARPRPSNYSKPITQNRQPRTRRCWRKSW